MTDDKRTFAPARLERFAAELFAAGGMDADKAATVARLLVLTDAMGRRTHGLAMAPLYLEQIAKGGMQVTRRAGGDRGQPARPRCGTGATCPACGS